ncbi:ring hydroxylating beta subunit [Burkholderia cenocepacia]|uniref:Ring hydroxylating beta subunit n=1 Tax=Burkholderia cenocepacia TaxID=95486 RepID=A0AAN0RRI4_9BURK|nr:ring hydroxylating beta subunit [Burkholderia cenocepacia]
MPQLDPTRIPTYPRTYASADLQHQIEQFLYLEAELLDDRKFTEWLELLSPEIHYVLSLDEHGDNNAPSIPGQITGYDDDKTSLERRVSTLATANDAGSSSVTTRRTISNVRIKPGDTDGIYKIRSNFILLRSRTGLQQDVVSGTRFDLVQRASSEVGFEIVRRWIFLDKTQLLANDIDVFL